MKSLKELEEKQHVKSDYLKSIFDEIKQEELSRKKKEDVLREENKRKADEEHKMKVEQNQVPTTYSNGI